MRHLLNTLFVTSEDVYLSLDNENVVINRNGTAIKKLPLRMFEQILYFGYMGARDAGAQEVNILTDFIFWLYGSESGVIGKMC